MSVFEELHPVVRSLMTQIRGLFDDRDVIIHPPKQKRAKNRVPRDTDSVEFHIDGVDSAEVHRKIATTDPDKYRWERLSLVGDSLIVTAGQGRGVVPEIETA